MKHRNQVAISALVASGVLWGVSVPLSKLALPWLGAGWLTVVRFAAGAVPLGLIGRRGLRDACAPGTLAAGAIGFGGVILLQNAGIEHTSVTHAALVVGAVPVLVALFVAGGGRPVTRPLTWVGYTLALAGVGLVAGAGGDGASATGDLLVLGSAVLSAAFITIQPRLLAGRDAAAVTAVQFAAGAGLALPFAFLAQAAPAAPPGAGPIEAAAALSLIATPLPFWLFAFGQAKVPAALAGAFVNLEPVVGAAIGWVAFGNAAGVAQLTGALAVLAGIALSAHPGDTEAESPGPARSRSPGHPPRRRQRLPCRRGSPTRSADRGPGARRRWRPRRRMAGRRAARDRVGDGLGSGERRPHRGNVSRVDGRRAHGLRRPAVADGCPLGRRAARRPG